MKIMKIRGKKGGERLLSIYWFVILAIITVGIVSGVMFAAGSNTDIREAEASLLKEKIVDCLVEKGELKIKIDDSADLMETCKIDLDDKTGKYTDIQYAVSVVLDNEEKNYGNQGLFVLCGIKDVRCVETKLYVLDENKGKFLEIKTAVRKTEQNEN